MRNNDKKQLLWTMAGLTLTLALLLSLTVFFSGQAAAAPMDMVALVPGESVQHPASQAEPVVDGLLDDSYIYLKHFSKSGSGNEAMAPGNLYGYEGTDTCYWAFVVDRAFNDNVYADKGLDDPYLQQDGWTKHKFKDLERSDGAQFDITYSDGSYTVWLDYLNKDRDTGQYASGESGDHYGDGLMEPISAAATSLHWNLENSGWDGGTWGDPEKHSPPYDYNQTSGNYWEWHMIYEFSIPKSAMNGECGDVDQGGAHNSPNKDDESKGKIGDRVWYDADGEGDQDADEDGIPGVTVELYQDGTKVRTTQTEPGTTGYYIFNNLEAGTYHVVVDEDTLPDGYVQTYPDTISHTVTITAGQVYTEADFGYVESMPDVDLSKLLVSPPEGSVAVSETVVFNIIITNTGDTTITVLPLTDLYDPAYFDRPAGDPIPNSVNITNGILFWNDLTADPPHGWGHDLTPGQSGVVTVTYHAKAASAMLMGMARPTAAPASYSEQMSCSTTTQGANLASEPTCDDKGTIGDYVWYDADGEGDQDENPALAGINGVTVRLYAGDCPPSGDPIDTQVTAGNGAYDFVGLSEGDYCVDVDESTLPSSLALTTGNEPHPVDLDDDDDYNHADFGYKVSGPCDVAVIPGAMDEYGHWTDLIWAEACVEIETPPRPSLELTPDDAEVTCNGPYTFTLTVNNTSDEPKDVARNVEITFSAIENSTYIDYVQFSNSDTWDPNAGNYTWIVGDIEASGSRSITYTVYMTPTWDDVPAGTEIKFYIEITREDNWPEHNVGKYAHATAIRCGVLPYVEAIKTVDPAQICLSEEPTVTLVAVGAGDPISERVPLDVMLVLDRSGSMSGQPLSDLKAAAKYFVDQLDPALDRVGLVSYATSASLDQHLTTDFAAVKSAIDAMVAWGFTNIGQGVNYAQAELDANGRPEALPVMIVFTDGVANRKTDGGVCETWPTLPTPCTEDAIAQAEAAKAAGTTIFTIGLMSKLESEHPECLPLARLVLRTMASDPSKYYEAPDSEDLEAIFAEIAYAVTNIAGRDVVITEVLPPYVHYVDGSANPPPTSIVSQTLTWDVGLLAIGERYTVTLRVTLDDIGLHQLVDVYPDSRVTYTNHEDQQVDVPFPETYIDVLAALLEFEKSGPAEVAAGQTFAYLLTYENYGNATADPVIITDVLPAAVDYVTSQPLGVEGPEGTIVWNLDPVPPGGPYTVVLTVTVDSDVEPGQELVNTMQWGYGACWGWGEGQTTFTQTVRSVVIGDYVWEDTNANGDQRDESGTGIASVTVDLHSGACDANGEPTGAVVSSTVTSATGFYSFTVAAGSGPYCIHIPDSEFESGGDLYGYNGSPQDAPGVPDDKDSDAHPTGHGITASAPASGDDLTFDFGFYWLGSLGDLVWWDVDNDGQQDAGEPGIPGVLVNLYDSSDQLVDTDTTDANGEYGFDSLPPDTYRIEIDASEFAPGGTLENWHASPQDAAGVPDDMDSDGDPDTHDVTTVLTAGEVDLTNDFGFDIESDYEISKRLNTIEPVRPGELVSFTIRITNTGDSWIGILPLRDVYSPTYLSFASASVTPEEPADDGQIDWYDLTEPSPHGFGTDLAPGASFTVIVTFTAMADTRELPGGETVNTATVHDAYADGDGPGPLGSEEPLPEKSDDDDVEIINPTGTVLAGFSAAAQPDGVRVEWQTASEVEILGFNVLRSEAGGEFIAINEELIFAQQAGRDAGAAYVYRDKDVAPGMSYHYTLEIVKSDGSVERYGLASATGRWWLKLPLVM